MEISKNNRVDLRTVNFFKAMQFIRAAYQYNMHGVDWAEIFVATDGRAVIVYKSGERIKTANAKGVEEIVEWYDHIPGVRRDGTLTHKYETKYRRSYQVDLDNLMKRGGPRAEAEKARLFINRAYDDAGGGYDLWCQRPAPFPYR